MKLDQDLAFPVKDAASADLMKLKAACLLSCRRFKRAASTRNRRAS